MRVVLVLVCFFIQANCFSQKKISIDSLLFEIQVSVTPARSVYLFVQTQKTFPNKNNELGLSYSLLNRTANIAIVGITEPQILEFATGPAKARVNLGTLKKGTYVIKITKNDSVAICKLRLRQKGYVLKVIQRGFLVNGPSLKGDYL